MQSELGHMGGASNGLISKMQLSQTATFYQKFIFTFQTLFMAGQI